MLKESGSYAIKNARDAFSDKERKERENYSRSNLV